MSQEAVELVEEMYAAWGRGDMQWFMDRSHPQIVIVQPPEVPDAKSYHGHRGIVEAFVDWPSQWDEFEVELVDVIEVDDDRVISVSRHRMKAREMEVEQEVCYLHISRDGLATRLEMFFSRDAALEAAGIGDGDAGPSAAGQDPPASQ
jgi:ketosteroid isomerase-like protein